jgi:hypothetical protein
MKLFGPDFSLFAGIERDFLVDFAVKRLPQS